MTVDGCDELAERKKEKPGTDVMNCYAENSGQGSKMILKTLWEWHKDVKLE